MLRSPRTAISSLCTTRLTTWKRNCVTDDETINAAHQKIVSLVRGIDENISIHDFRMVTGPTHTNVIFDAVVPYGCALSDREAEEKIKRAVHELDPRYFAIVQIDKSYVR